MRDSFIIYRSFFEAISELEPEQQATMWRSICEYALDRKEPQLTGITKTVFTLIKPQMDSNFKKYKTGVEHGSKGAEHGKKGGRPRANNPQITLTEPSNNPQITLSIPTNDNVNDNEHYLKGSFNGKEELTEQAFLLLVEELKRDHLWLPELTRKYHIEKSTTPYEEVVELFVIHLRDNFYKMGRPVMIDGINHFKNACENHYKIQKAQMAKFSKERLVV